MKICYNRLSVLMTVLFLSGLLFPGPCNAKFLNNLYHSVEEIYSELSFLEAGVCREILSKHYISSDDNKNKMTYFVLSQIGDTTILKKRVVMIFGEHSRELISSELGLYFIRVLCKEEKAYDEETVSAILANYDFVIVPVVNEFGRNKVQEGDYCWRTNENGVDINRNWDSHWKKDSTLGSNEYPGDHPFSEWESQVLSKLIRINQPEVFISTHAGTLGMYTPFAYKKFSFDLLDGENAKKLSNMLKIIKNVNSKYCDCKAGAIGNELWYLCPGTCLDYAYEQLKVKYTFAFEIYDGFSTNLHFKSIIDDPNIKTFNYRAFLKENGVSISNPSSKFLSTSFSSNLIQKSLKIYKQQQTLSHDPINTYKYEHLSYHIEKNHYESCFSQFYTEKLDLDDCKKQMNPLTELHFKNTLINWVNVYFELFALISLNE